MHKIVRPPLYPQDPDYGVIYRNYIVKSETYPDLYKFRDILNHITCDYSEYPQDWFTFKNGMIQSHWIIFVCALPKEIERMGYVARRRGMDIEIIDEFEDDLYLPFELEV